MTEVIGTGPIVRAARMKDRAAILHVAEASQLFSATELTDIQAALDAYLHGTTPDDRWVCSDTGTGVDGIAYYGPERMTHGTWNLYLLAVHPDRHGQGRGTALVRHVEHDLRQSGARVLLIETSAVPEFAGQRAFYTRLGYHHEARIRDFYRTGDDKIIYWKALTPATLDEPVEPPADQPQRPATAVTLRTAQSADLTTVLELAEAFYREAGFTTGRDQLRVNLETLLGAETAHTALAEQAGQVVGFAITTTSFGLENGVIAELEDLYIQPSSRRQGLGGKLIEDSAVWARRLGAHQLEIVTVSQGTDISHLHTYYAAQGFDYDGRRIHSRPLP